MAVLIMLPNVDDRPAIISEAVHTEGKRFSKLIERLTLDYMTTNGNKCTCRHVSLRRSILAVVNTTDNDYILAHS